MAITISICSRSRSSTPFPPCHTKPTWWLRIGRLQTKQFIFSILFLVLFLGCLKRARLYSGYISTAIVCQVQEWERRPTRKWFFLSSFLRWFFLSFFVFLFDDVKASRKVSERHKRNNKVEFLSLPSRVLFSSSSYLLRGVSLHAKALLKNAISSEYNTMNRLGRVKTLVGMSY